MNGHAHLLYALNIAVRTAPDASVKALKYAAAVERSLCEKLCADVNYSGLICKNPFHLEWQVMEWREDAYTLDELADYLDLSASERRSIDKHYGMGRNCHLFEMTRKWAYRAIRQGWPAFSQWLDAVIQRVEMYNASLPFRFHRLNVGLLARVLRNTRTGTSRRKLSHSMWLIRTHQKFRQHAVARAGRPIRQKISRTKGKKRRCSVDC